MEHCTSSASGTLLPSDFGRSVENADRRREPRLRVERDIVIMPLGSRTGLKFRPARLVDCSRSGVGIEWPEPLAVGEQFMVRARLKEAVMLIYTVRNCRVWPGGYRIGGQLSDIVGTSDGRNPALALDALLEGCDEA